MPDLCAQGDILLESVDNVPHSASQIRPAESGSIIIAEGEATGHSHKLIGTAVLFRDDALARDIPVGLYVGHLWIEGVTARLEHEEHAPIALREGTYRIRRQRQLQPDESGLMEGAGVIDD